MLKVDNIIPLWRSVIPNTLNLERKHGRESQKKTISVSSEIIVLQMVLELDIERCDSDQKRTISVSSRLLVL